MLLHLNIKLTDGMYFGDVKTKIRQRLQKHLLRIRKHNPTFEVEKIKIHFHLEDKEKIYQASDFLVFTHLIAEQLGTESVEHKETFLFQKFHAMLAIEIEVIEK